MPQGPGWYPDYGNPNVLRWFDGRVWTDQVTAPPRGPSRPIIFGPLLALAGIAVMVFLFLTHPSVSVPLAGVQDCGVTSVHAAITTDQEAESGATGITRALDAECVTKGRTNVYKGLGGLVIGLVAGGMVGTYERRR